jgi:large subunit ribosomal protein L2
MGVRQFKPVTKSSRFRSVSDFSEITRTHGEKSLMEPLTKSGGRDNHGHIAMRRIGGGHKRMYRIIDFKRNKHGMTATVREIEYDPNRTARIALVEYEDGEKRYIIHPKGLSVGDKIVSGKGSDSRVGNALPLREIPLGTDVHCVELKPGAGGKMARSAGTKLEVVAKEGEYVTLRMASTDMRMVHGDCLATVGTVGNAEHELLSAGKAGKSRWMGKRPKVRGEVMNPVDHPHGGRTRGGRNVVD